MSTYALLADARRAGMTLGVKGTGEDVRIVWEADHEPPDHLLAEMRLHKSELIAVLSAQAARSDQDNQDAGDDIDECAALIETRAGVPQAWAEGFIALCNMPPPSGFLPDRWQRIINATGFFLDRWAAEAIRCGWNYLDVFGCEREAPTARFDAMGLVMSLDRREIVSIDSLGADLITAGGARQRFRRRPLPIGTVCLWELARYRA